MDQPRWLDEAEARAWRAYTHMRVQVQGRLARDLARSSGLSEADYAVLVNLSEAPRGRLRHFELCEVLQWDRGRLSHQLTRMSRRGLVKKERCETDARGGYAVISADGRTAIEAAAPAHVASVRRHFLDALDPAQLAALTDLSETVLAHLDADESDVG